MAKDWEVFQDIQAVGYFKTPNIKGILTSLRTAWPSSSFKATELTKSKGWRIWRRSK